MQPLAYFAVRCLLGWLQYLERVDRAFAASALLLVATGAAHCWAVVYALFIAIHTRAMRFEGYHEGYKEHLPFWVEWTETLSVGSMAIWWAAGIVIVAIRLIDEDPQGLPMDGNDLELSLPFRIMRSPRLHAGLSVAHTLSCVGLFSSIILLCMAMAMMKGFVTACEFSLCCVALGFALPHAAVACRRLRCVASNEVLEVVSPAAEAGALEAAALGPQLCVILALADSPDHAYPWQKVVYILSAAACIASIVACGRTPAKGGAALPPETGEFVTCLALDAAASVALVMCFPHLNTWHLWALLVPFLGALGALLFEDWREIIVELLDPLLVIRSDTDKALPGKWRDRLRRLCWATALICAAVALWDIVLHPMQDSDPDMPEFGERADDAPALPDIWDQNSMMLLRYHDNGEAREERELLALAAEALEVDAASDLAVQRLLPDHRLLLFKVANGEHRRGLPAHIRWKLALQEPKGAWPAVVDTSFPSTLNVTLCLQTHAIMEASGQQQEAGEPVLPPEFDRVVGDAPGARDAYLAGCGWWTHLLDTYYGQENSTHAHSPLPVAP